MEIAGGAKRLPRIIYMKRLIPAIDIVTDVLSVIEGRYSNRSTGERHWIKAPRFIFSSVYGAIPTEQLVYIRTGVAILRDLAPAWISAQLAIKRRIPVIVIANAAQSRAYIELAIASLAEVSPKALTTGIFHREFWPPMTHAASSLAESSIFFLSPKSPGDLEKAVRHLWKKHDSVAVVASPSLIEGSNLTSKLILPNMTKAILDRQDAGVIWVGERAISFKEDKTPTSLLISVRKMGGLRHEVIVNGWASNNSSKKFVVGERPANDTVLQPKLFKTPLQSPTMFFHGRQFRGQPPARRNSKL